MDEHADTSVDHCRAVCRSTSFVFVDTVDLNHAQQAGDFLGVRDARHAAGSLLDLYSKLAVNARAGAVAAAIGRRITRA